MFLLLKKLSASNKLKEFLGNKKTTYAEFSIEITQDLIVIIIYYRMVRIFNKHKKKMI